MTTRELRDLLRAAIGHLIGTYQLPGGATLPAIWIGEPPSDYTASGLEVRIADPPDISQVAAHQAGAIVEEHQVRLVSHGTPTNQRVAVRALLSRWPDAQASAIPANEELGILSQHVIRIPA